MTRLLLTFLYFIFGVRRTWTMELGIWNLVYRSERTWEKVGVTDDESKQ